MIVKHLYSQMADFDTIQTYKECFYCNIVTIVRFIF